MGKCSGPSWASILSTHVDFVDGRVGLKGGSNFGKNSLDSLVYRVDAYARGCKDPLGKDILNQAIKRAQHFIASLPTQDKFE